MLVQACPDKDLLGSCYQALMPDSDLKQWTFYYAPYTAQLASVFCAGSGGVWQPPSRD